MSGYLSALETARVTRRKSALYRARSQNRNHPDPVPTIPDRIYLDHAATSPLRPEARAAMEEGFRIWANPSSPHAEGRRAKAALQDARERIKRALGWDGELIFTSGASEAAELAIDYAKASRHFATAVEHDALMRPNVDETLPVGSDGGLDLDFLDSRLAVEMLRRPDTDGNSLVAVQHLNSETGNCQDLPTVARRVHAGEGNLLLCDCSQSAGKFPIPGGPDMVIVSAHKFGGPIGVGALLVREFDMLFASGGQERGYRRGTENLPAVLGMSAALEACSKPFVNPDVLEPFAALAPECRNVGGTWLSDHLSSPTPYIVALSMPNIGASVQVMRFDMVGISVSQGSACSSGKMKTSRVLEAMGMDRQIADRTIRVSVGWDTTRAEVERFCEVWIDMAKGA